MRRRGPLNRGGARVWQVIEGMANGAPFDLVEGLRAVAAAVLELRRQVAELGREVPVVDGVVLPVAEVKRRSGGRKL